MLGELCKHLPLWDVSASTDVVAVGIVAMVFSDSSSLRLSVRANPMVGQFPAYKEVRGASPAL